MIVVSVALGEILTCGRTLGTTSMVLGSETVGAEPGRSQLEEKEPWVGGV